MWIHPAEKLYIKQKMGKDMGESIRLLYSYF